MVCHISRQKQKEPSWQVGTHVWLYHPMWTPLAWTQLWILSKTWVPPDLMFENHSPPYKLIIFGWQISQFGETHPFWWISTVVGGLNHPLLGPCLQWFQWTWLQPPTAILVVNQHFFDCNLVTHKSYFTCLVQQT